MTCTFQHERARRNELAVILIKIVVWERWRQDYCSFLGLIQVTIRLVDVLQLLVAGVRRINLGLRLLAVGDGVGVA